MWSPRASELRPGELFAIHAGSRRDEDSWIVARSIARDLAQRGSYDPVPVGINIRTAPYSAIVGVATLDEVRTEPRIFRDDAGEYEDQWWCGPIGWYMRDPVPFDPVPCKGARGLWVVEGETLDVVRERYRAAR